MPEIQMPKLSDTMTEGTLVAWKKKKGDKVLAGDVIAEIETDKATMEWESPEDGTLTEIYVEEGAKVNVGDKIAFIGGEGEKPPTSSSKVATESPQPVVEKKEEETPKKRQSETEKPRPAAEKQPDTAPPQRAAQEATSGSSPENVSGSQPRIKASPAARRAAAELG